jgi:general secretion pathway protein H
MHPQSQESGFTLIEMIVVLAILGMVAGLVLVRTPWHSSSVDTEAALRSLTNTLRLAQSRAVVEDRDVMVDLAANGFYVDRGPMTVLPAGEELKPMHLVFTADGGSTGATILFSAGESRFLIDVNWLTGRVRRVSR